MHPTLKIEFEKLELQLENLIKFVSASPKEKLIFKRAEADWSCLQILTHLLTSERMSLAYMKKKSLGIDELSDTGLKQSFIMMMLKVSQRLPFKYKAPKIVVENTPDALPLDQLKEKWQKARNDLRSFLEKIDDKHIHKAIYKHPVGGRLNVRQALQFFREHVNHHFPQIKKLINS